MPKHRPSRSRPTSRSDGPALPSRARKRVALLIETSNAYGRNLLLGVVSYIREHSPWSFYLVEQGRGDAPPAWLAGWDGDGIIARIENRRIAAAVLRTGLPAVDVSAGRFVPTLPWVETDDEAIARCAAQHLLERGFKQFAFCGDARFAWSREREAAFTRMVRDAGFRCETFRLGARLREVAAENAALETWLRRLPKPVGIFACYDIRGQQVLEACRSRGLAVPDEVAVLGVDNDELLCELADPPMSSVIPDSRQTGYRAAALLDQLMRGQRPAQLENRVAPLGVLARQSTDVLAIDDPHVVKAVRFIREHACDPIDVSDVLRVIPVSRRILERRFSRLLRHSPHAEIIAVRLNRVKQLLAASRLSLEEIAQRAGFEHPEYLSVVFKRELGLTPRAFRQLSRRAPRAGHDSQSMTPPA